MENAACTPVLLVCLPKCYAFIVLDPTPLTQKSTGNILIMLG